MSQRAQHRSDRVATLNDTLGDTANTAFAMALLWIIPVIAFLLTLTRL